MVCSLGIKASSPSISGSHHSPSNLGIERYIEAKEEKKPESLKQPVPVLVQPVQALVTQPIVPVFPETISYPAWPVHWLSLEVAA